MWLPAAMQEYELIKSFLRKWWLPDRISSLPTIPAHYQRATKPAAEKARRTSFRIITTSGRRWLLLFLITIQLKQNILYGWQQVLRLVPVVPQMSITSHIFRCFQMLYFCLMSDICFITLLLEHILVCRFEDSLIDHQFSPFLYVSDTISGTVNRYSGSISNFKILLPADPVLFHILIVFSASVFSFSYCSSFPAARELPVPYSSSGVSGKQSSGDHCGNTTMQVPAALLVAISPTSYSSYSRCFLYSGKYWSLPFIISQQLAVLVSGTNSNVGKIITHNVRLFSVSKVLYRHPLQHHIFWP